VLGYGFSVPSDSVHFNETSIVADLGRAEPDPTTALHTLAPPIINVNGPGTAFGMAVADLNGDGIPDVATSNATFAQSTAGVYIGKGDGTFSGPVTYPTGYFPDGVAIGDFNNDGVPDIAITNQGDTARALAFLDEAETLCRSLNDLANLQAALGSRVIALYERREVEAALRIAQGDPHGAIVALAPVLSGAVVVPPPSFIIASSPARNFISMKLKTEDLVSTGPPPATGAADWYVTMRDDLAFLGYPQSWRPLAGPTSSRERTWSRDRGWRWLHWIRSHRQAARRPRRTSRGTLLPLRGQRASARRVHSRSNQTTGCSAGTERNDGGAWQRFRSEEPLPGSLQREHARPKPAA